METSYDFLHKNIGKLLKTKTNIMISTVIGAIEGVQKNPVTQYVSVNSFLFILKIEKIKSCVFVTFLLKSKILQDVFYIQSEWDKRNHAKLLYEVIV